MTAKLPPMPEPAFDLLWHNGAYYVCAPSANTVACYTADQLQADRLAVWKAAIEAAAQACETFQERTLGAQEGRADALANVMLRQVAILGFGEAASAIRAMGDLKG